MSDGRAASIRLVRGPNHETLRLLAMGEPLFDLAYLDPPFMTQRTFRTKDGPVAFGDWWESREAYLDDLLCTAYDVRALLKPHGSFVLHLDSRVSHYAKVALDRVFGEDAFASEIVWRYRRWPSKQKNFQRVHDVLLRWVKDPEAEPRWNQAYEPKAPSTLKAWGTGKQRAKVVGGKRVRSESTAEQSPGVPMGDVWDIGIIAPSSRERTGYPTQKPEALIERLVLALTNPGDDVLDPYCGSGSTPAVCRRLGRGCLGIDESPEAIKACEARLGIVAMPGI